MGRKLRHSFSNMVAEGRIGVPVLTEGGVLAEETIPKS